MKSAPKQRPAATEQNQTKQTPGQMDRSLRETVDGVPHVNTKRPCWAAKTLAEEVTELFPETRITYDNYDGRGAALDLGIDMADLNSQGREDLSQLIHLLGGAEGSGRILVRPTRSAHDQPFAVALMDDVEGVLAARATPGGRTMGGAGHSPGRAAQAAGGPLALRGTT